jgi:hypothetical protein
MLREAGFDARQADIEAGLQEVFAVGRSEIDLGIDGSHLPAA